MVVARLSDLTRAARRALSGTAAVSRSVSSCPLLRETGKLVSATIPLRLPSVSALQQGTGEAGTDLAFDIDPMNDAGEHRCPRLQGTRER